MGWNNSPFFVTIHSSEREIAFHAWIRSKSSELYQLETLRIPTFRVRAFQIIQVIRIKFRVAFLAFPHVSVPVLMDFPPGTRAGDAT
jgi:hypothetical protein